jgi:hypothetical protein
MMISEDERLASGHALAVCRTTPVRALRIAFLIGLAVALLPTGCATSAKVNESFLYVPPGGADRSIIEPGDAIVIIPAQGADCLREPLLQVHPTLHIVSPDAFRRAAFPDHTADEVTFAFPIAEPQQKLLATQTFRDRIAPLRLRYLVSVDEKEESRHEGTTGDLFSVTTFEWITSFAMTASVIDLKDGREVGPISIHAEGQRVLVTLYPFFPIFWFVETIRGPVCKALGEGLGNYLAGRAPSSGSFTSAPSDYARAAYERGNYATALWLFRTRAEQGDADAQNNLGNMYRNAEGVAQDYVQAYMWFTLAAAHFPASEIEKHEKAIRDREEVAAKMTAEQIAEAQQLAADWKPK